MKKFKTFEDFMDDMVPQWRNWRTRGSQVKVEMLKRAFAAGRNSKKKGKPDSAALADLRLNLLEAQSAECGFACIDHKNYYISVKTEVANSESPNPGSLVLTWMTNPAIGSPRLSSRETAKKILKRNGVTV